MMNRKSNWEDALSQYLIENKDIPFEYGKNDCCTFAAGAVESITGVNPMSEFIGKYKSAASSLRAIKDAGYKSLEEVIDAKFDQVPIGFASTGDLALFDGSIGVVMGNAAAFVSDDGFAIVKRQLWDKTWGVARG